VDIYSGGHQHKMPGCESGSSISIQAVQDHPSQSKIVKINVEEPDRLYRIGDHFKVKEEPDSFVTLGEMMAVEKIFGPEGKWFFNTYRSHKVQPRDNQLSYVTLDFESGFNSVATITPATIQQLIKD
jgi:hypothetical protein